MPARSHLLRTMDQRSDTAHQGHELDIEKAGWKQVKLAANLIHVSTSVMMGLAWLDPQLMHI